jgi:hypothetical protein
MCEIENKMAPYFKKEVGIKMEDYVTKNIPCQICFKNSLKALKDFSPSLDIVCESCGAIYEVKSKCLSIKILPKDIFCNGGNFIEFKKNINNGLNLFIILYGVDREKKEILIRNIYYVSNKQLVQEKIIEIDKKNNTTLSTIKIFDRDFLKSLNIKEKLLSFKDLYNNLIKTMTV